MQTVGTSAFYTAFRRLLRARMPFATFLTMRFDPGKVPALLDSWFIPEKLPSEALNEYLNGTYRFDPFFQYTSIPDGGCLHRLPEIAPDRFFSSEYYIEY